MIYEKGRYIKRSLAEVMEAASSNGIPFLRKVDVEMPAEAHDLLQELQTKHSAPT